MPDPRLASPDQPGGGPRPLDPVRHAAELVEAWSGVAVSESQLSVFADELSRIGGAAGVPGAALRLAAGDGAARTAILDHVSPPETYFFRHPSHFEVLASLARSRRARGRSCVVLSAGCSTGEEAWSAAITLAVHAGPGSDQDRVIGWDLAPERIARASEGRYGAWSVRAGMNGYDALFRRDGDAWAIDPRVRAMVRFEQRNLLDDALPWPGRFDAIFFRNVAIYWKPETFRRVARNLARLLAHDGVLLVGPCDPIAEELPGWRSEIVDGARVVRPPRDDSPADRASASELRAPKEPATPTIAGPASAPERGGDDLLACVEALSARGAHAEALDLLRSRSLATPAARRCEGVLLLSLGYHAEALRLFRQCVFLEPEDPTHRRWLATSLAAMGRREDAERESRNALALEQR